MKKGSRKGEADDKDEGIVEKFLGGSFGDFFKELGKTEVFTEKFKEVNKKIEENLRQGREKKWSVEGNISVRPLSIRPSMGPSAGVIKKETPESELSLQKDYVYEKREGRLLLAVKVPDEDVAVTLTGRNIMIKGGSFQKKIELPGYYKSIKSRRYKQGILALELVIY